MNIMQIDVYVRTHLNLQSVLRMAVDRLNDYEQLARNSVVVDLTINAVSFG